VKHKKAILMIMDGWGWREDPRGNAVLAAHTPTFDMIRKKYASTLIQASGTHVGLPEGQMGNSEVGHLNLGAGRVVYQNILRISQAIDDGSIRSNPAIESALKAARGHTLHFLGLLSDGGVHSHNTHLYALLGLAARAGLDRVAVHVILDGRDTPPHAGVDYIAQLEEQIRRHGVGRIATVVGRYYCMDRDHRWDRTKRAWDLLVSGEGEQAADAGAAVRGSYDRGVTDEFVKPICVVDDGKPVARIEDGDSVIFFNFRADRARQITHAFVDEPFDGFDRGERPHVRWTCMTRYEESFDLPVAFPAEVRKNILAEVAAEAERTSLRIAETEKYAHVTYFFNGGEETEWPGETRALIPSPEVATYDLKPEMSARGITDRLLDELATDRHDYIICNFANADMVGHTGVFDAAVKACETVDACVGRVLAALDLDRYMAIVTADHGNADEMIDFVHGGPHTAHTQTQFRAFLWTPITMAC